MSVAFGGRRANPRRHFRRTTTLIPVTLRLLDETGRHRIAESMLGILTEISSEGLRVNVLGPAGRPLSRGLSRKQKVLIAFLASELHEKVESLVCELKGVDGHRTQPDAWLVRLALPQLPPELTAEIFEALGRYGPAEPSGRLWGRLTLGFAVLGSLLVASWAREASLERARLAERAERLNTQLVYSTQTVDRLAGSLEEADQELDRLRKSLRSQAEQKEAVEALRTLFSGQAEQKAEPEPRKPAPVPRVVRLRETTWQGFQAVRAVRGDAPSPKLTYLNDAIELAEPTSSGEKVRRMLTRLLSTYATSAGIDLRAVGVWSLDSPDLKIGLEPEEAFVLGPEERELPDFVFEITRSNQMKERLDAYKALGIREIWVWTEGRLKTFQLRDGRYEAVASSLFLPGLDLQLLERYLERADQTQATRDFAETLRAP